MPSEPVEKTQYYYYVFAVFLGHIQHTARNFF